jgi:hypothetical protein
MPSGRLVEGGWLGDPDLPARPVCSLCRSRWGYEARQVEALIALVG